MFFVSVGSMTQNNLVITRVETGICSERIVSNARAYHVRDMNEFWTMNFPELGGSKAKL